MTAVALHWGNAALAVAIIVWLFALGWFLNWLEERWLEHLRRKHSL